MLTDESHHIRASPHVVRTKAGGGRAHALCELLHTVGAKSGLERVNPLAYGIDADRLFVISSKGGDDDNPYLFHNVVAHPQVIVEVGADTLHMQACISAEPERTRLFDKLATEHPGFRDYQALTKRIMPVVILSRV